MRVFPSPQLRRIICWTIGVNLVQGAVFILVDVLYCIPLSTVWEQWYLASPNGKCLNMNAAAWSHGAFNIALDFWILLLPVREIQLLQIPSSKKWGVGFMFSVGIL